MDTDMFMGKTQREDGHLQSQGKSPGIDLSLNALRRKHPADILDF